MLAAGMRAVTVRMIVVVAVYIGVIAQIAGQQRGDRRIGNDTEFSKKVVLVDENEMTTRTGVFAGGDCVTGPATVIRAIAAGKVAAANIDEYLGFHHEIDPGVEIPTARLNNKPPHGRINTTEREADERKRDFKCIECGLTDEEAYSEASRCLRCDHFGYGIFRGGRKGKW